MSIEFYWVAVVAIAVLSTARIARLLTIDKFPPVKRLRDRYENKTEGTGWEWLTMCAFCMAPWVALFVLGWGDLAGVFDGEPAWGQVDDTFNRPAWIAFNGWLAVAYLAGSYVARDGSGEDGV